MVWRTGGGAVSPWGKGEIAMGRHAATGVGIKPAAEGASRPAPQGEATAPDIAPARGPSGTLVAAAASAAHARAPGPVRCPSDRGTGSGSQRSSSMSFSNITVVGTKVAGGDVRTGTAIKPLLTTLRLLCGHGFFSCLSCRFVKWTQSLNVTVKTLACSIDLDVFIR